MIIRMEDSDMPINIYARYVYIFHDKITGHTYGATDLRTLGRKTPVTYNQARYWFQQQRMDIVDKSDFVIYKVLTDLIFNKNSK